MSNLLTNPRQWRNKALLIKLETTYGTDSTPTGAANWIEARNVTLTPMDNDKVARNIDLPYMGSAGDIVVSSWAKLTFDVALVGSGTAGTAPKWGPLMVASGMAETIVAATSATYNLVSTSFSSACAYMNIDGVNHAMNGGRGDVKFKFGAKGTPMLSFSFDFNYVAPAALALPTVTRTGWQIEEGVNSANTLPLSINSVNLAMSDLEYGLGNKVVRNDLPGPQREVAITDRTPTCTATVLAPALATFNPFTLVAAATTVPVTTTHGSTAGLKIQSTLQARISNVEYTNVENMAAYKLTLQPVPVNGNDEIVVANI